MTIYIDYVNKHCFILSPKCGTQTISKFLNLPLNMSYDKNELIKVLKDPEIKKIIVVREVVGRFLSGFYEDLKNNNCYFNLDISFEDYINFICYCYDNKIKNVNNLNVFYKNNDTLIEWGQCSSLHLPITDSLGNLSGHIIHQIAHIKPYTNMLNENDNVEIIDISELNKFTNICENSKPYDINKSIDNIKKYNFNSLLSELKKDEVFPKKEKMINPHIESIINHIYESDSKFIEDIKIKFNSC